MFNKVLFYSNKNSERLQYTIKLVFSDILGLDVFFTQSSQIFMSSSLPKINYSDNAFTEEDIFIKSNILLFESHIIKRDFEKEFQDFDIFSKIFILVSRYEEYIAPPSVFDHHERFTAQASFSKKLDILKIPVVNQWALEIGEQLKDKFPELKISPPLRQESFGQYKVQLTYDIDQAWAFKNKGLLRNIGGLLKDVLKLKFKSVFTRLKVLININNDPEFTFDYIEKLHKKHENKVLNPIFFWLLADFGEHDKNIEWTNNSLQRLIRRLAKKHPVGIHPSYASNADDAILKKEIGRLNKILPDTEALPRLLGEPITKSRQHYLKLRFPTTYQRLIQAGITDDYSMGYSDDIGFRAGIATPFYWYDLENERATTLRIHPFQVMEVTLNEYLHLSPDEAIERVKPIIESIKAVGGTFTTLWHNSTLTDNESAQASERGYEGWRKVYEEIIESAIL